MHQNVKKNKSKLKIAILLWKLKKEIEKKLLYILFIIYLLPLEYKPHKGKAEILTIWFISVFSAHSAWYPGRSINVGCINGWKRELKKHKSQWWEWEQKQLMAIKSTSWILKNWSIRDTDTLIAKITSSTLLPLSMLIAVWLYRSFHE